MKIVLTVVIGGILGIAILTIGLLTFLGNKMRNDMAAANAAGTSLVMPTPTGDATVALQPSPAAPGAVPADYLVPERKFHDAFLKWNADYNAARQRLYARTITASTTAAFESTIGAIIDERKAYTDVPTRFGTTNDLFGQGLEKVLEGAKAADANDVNGVNQIKGGEDIMVQSLGQFNQTCEDIRVEGARKGVKFD